MLKKVFDIHYEVCIIKSNEGVFTVEVGMLFFRDNKILLRIYIVHDK